MPASPQQRWAEAPHRIGNRGGAQVVTQTPAQLAPHDHGVTGTVMAVGGPGSAVTPAGNFAAINPAAANLAPLAPGGVAVAMGPGSVPGAPPFFFARGAGCA